MQVLDLTVLTKMSVNLRLSNRLFTLAEIVFWKREKVFYLELLVIYYSQ